MTTIKPGDMVRTTSRRVYTVSHVGPKAFSLAPLSGPTAHRHSANARRVELIRSVELVRFFTLIHRARVALIDRGDVFPARVRLEQAATYLQRAHARRDDGPGELRYAREVLRLNIAQLRREVAS